MLSFALTAYDDEYESIEDPDFGVLNAYYVRWGYPEVSEGDSAIGYGYTQLATHQCTNEDLGIKEDGTPASKRGLFFKTHPNSLNDLKFYNRKFKCFDDPDIAIHGDFNTAMTQNIIVQFEKCD